MPTFHIHMCLSIPSHYQMLPTYEYLTPHITPVLRQLHWLSVSQRVQFKLACIMYKSLSGQAPSTWSMMSSYLLTAVGIYFDQPTTEHASFHGHRTVSATEPFLLTDLKSGTICHRNCDTWTSALDNSETC